MTREEAKRILSATTPFNRRNQLVGVREPSVIAVLEHPSKSRTSAWHTGDDQPLDGSPQHVSTP